jgi:hypothetical protein
MKKMMIVLGLVVAVVLGITYVYAQGPGYGRTGWGHGKWSSSTPEQGTRFQELRQSFNDGMVQFGPGWGIGPGFIGGHTMGYGYGRGRGYGMGRGYGRCY